MTQDEPKETPSVLSDLSDAVAEHLAPKAHMGHPLDPHRGRVLSEDDEKSLDEQGQPVVEGLPWSKAGTGLYVLIAVTTVKPTVSAPVIAGVSAGVPKAIVKMNRNLTLTVGTTYGKPTFDCPTWGACLELPSDLGKDRLKQQYIVEWLAETTVEALTEAGVNFKKAPERTDDLGMWVAFNAEQAIRATGL